MRKDFMTAAEHRRKRLLCTAEGLAGTDWKSLRIRSAYWTGSAWRAVSLLLSSESRLHTDT